MHEPTTPDDRERSGTRLSATVIISTFNRATQLAETLQSIAGTQAPGISWDVLVVDNNSTDGTRSVVEQHAARFPVPLRCVFEGRQGFSVARNTGIAACSSDVLAFTDDDVRVSPGWLNSIVDGLERYQCDYVAGRVVPLWEREPPEWFPRENGLLWGVIAILDYGPEPMELRRRVPLGVNMAVRRRAFERIGEFDVRLGRKAGTLLGQETREWCLRARASGLVGFYLPDAVLHHLIPATRLTKRYFRRWFYWRGVSRAMLYEQTGADMERPEASHLRFGEIPHIAGVPRYMFRSAVDAGYKTIAAKLRQQPAESFERELWLWSFAGIVRHRWANRHIPPGSLGSMASERHQ